MGLAKNSNNFLRSHTDLLCSQKKNEFKFSCVSVSSAVIHEFVKQPVLAVRLCGQRCAWVVAQCSLSQFGNGSLC